MEDGTCVRSEEFLEDSMTADWAEMAVWKKMNCVHLLPQCGGWRCRPRSALLFQTLRWLERSRRGKHSPGCRSHRKKPAETDTSSFHHQLCCCFFAADLFICTWGTGEFCSTNKLLLINGLTSFFPIIAVYNNIHILHIHICLNFFSFSERAPV